MNFLELFKSILYVVFIGIININPTNAQFESMSFGLEAGLAINRISGEVRDELDEWTEDYEYRNDDYEKFKSNISSVNFINWGMIVGYAINENIGIRSGFRFNKRGFNLKINGEVNEPTSQLEYDFELKAKYNVKTLEVPLTAVYSLTEQTQLIAGILLGWGMKETAVANTEYYAKFRINGELDESLSEDWREEEARPFSVDNPYLGWTVGVDYNLFSNLYAGITLQGVGNYAELNIGELSDVSLVLGVKFIIGNKN